MCFSSKTHENIGGSVNCVQYNSDIWIFNGIPNVAFVNKRFWKKGTSGIGFYYLLSCLLGSRRTKDAHWGQVRQQPRVFPAQGSRARTVRGAGPLTVLIIRQEHGDRASLRFTSEIQPASEGNKAQGRVQARQWDGSSQNQDWRACLRQSHLQQGSQGENHKCKKPDATFNNSGHCFKWTGACISNGISSNLLLSAFIIQFSVSERYKTERYRTDGFYGQAFYR